MNQKVIGAKILASGTVQGVGFRPFVYRIATSNNLSGHVRNLSDGEAEISVQGNEADIRRFLGQLENDKPPLARYDKLVVRYFEVTATLRKFEIEESSKAKELSGSVIPADVSICDDCLQDLRRIGDRRSGYFFVTCTDCGPRFSTIVQVPYDRENTTMAPFKMCLDCEREYGDSKDRRFNSQTIACPVCGPRTTLYDNKGRVVSSEDPIRFAGRLIEEGSIVAIKDNGGFHIGASSLKSEPLKRLRRVKHRANKPFAVLARDLERTKSFASVGLEEELLLTSRMKPIVLLEKNDSYFLSELVAPHLQNVGVMLPYSALHLLLFDDAKEEPAFVMTSGNPPSEPIVMGNQEAFEKLRGVVDYFLMHDREIAQRSDDSVVRVNCGTPTLIRRSRGYAPAPVILRKELKRSVLGVGAEFMVTSCVSFANRAFLSQHIGDMESVETHAFFKEATSHLLQLTNIRPEGIACDLHPSISTTRIARSMSEELHVELVRVQHHHAHIASLMAEHGIDEMIGIASDGVGYGTDGNLWGGEVLECHKGDFKRVSHLVEQLLPGGDATVLHPLRMLAAILSYDFEGLEPYLSERAADFREKGNEQDLELFREVLKNSKNLPKTTSTGRILDAVASALGVCFERTYEGEPAIRLEAAASGGHDVLKLEPRIMEGSKLDTTFLLQEIFGSRKRYRVADLACSAHSYVARGLATLALNAAEKSGIRTIGFSGGVAYNELISGILRETIEKNESLKFVSNIHVPSGDGGISLGQAYVGALKLE